MGVIFDCINTIVFSRACFRRGSNGFPRSSDLLKIPLQAVTLKKYLSGTLSSKIENKEHTLASLGDSPKLSVKSSPSDRGMISHDEPPFRPFLPSRSVFLKSRNAIASFADLPERFEDCSEVFALCRAKSSVNILPNCDLWVSSIGGTPHFRYNSHRFKKEAGLFSGQPLPVTGD